MVRIGETAFTRLDEAKVMRLTSARSLCLVLASKAWRGASEPEGVIHMNGGIIIAAFVPRTGDAMQDSTNLKVLFIAGFGPIVRDTDKSRKLYRDALGIPFKEEPDGYLHTEAVQGAKSFA